MCWGWSIRPLLIFSSSQLFSISGYSMIGKHSRQITPGTKGLGDGGISEPRNEIDILTSIAISLLIYRFSNCSISLHPKCSCAHWQIHNWDVLRIKRCKHRGKFEMEPSNLITPWMLSASNGFWLSVIYLQDMSDIYYTLSLSICQVPLRSFCG